jgi:hypothetical protein
MAADPLLTPLWLLSSPSLNCNFQMTNDKMADPNVSFKRRSATPSAFVHASAR